VKPIAVRPLTPRPETPATAAGAARQRIVVVSHVPPWPAAAGNEFRLARLISWLEGVGYAVHFVYRPFPDRAVTDQIVRDLVTLYPRTYVFDAEHNSVSFGTDDQDVYDVLLGLAAGSRGPDFEQHRAADKAHLDARLFNLTRTFAPDLLIELVLRLVSRVSPVAVIAQYVFMSRLIRAMPNTTLRMIDLIDVFSSKEEKVLRFGVDDSLAMSGKEEAYLLAGADAVIAIHEQEAAAVRRLAPALPVITAGIDYPVLAQRHQPSGHTVLVIGSDNAMNTAGLEGFVRFAWPTVLRDVPDANLVVIGSIGKALSGAEPNVTILGKQDDLTSAYASARVAINPAIAGTGVKVKTLEAIAHLCPIVLWPSGADGLVDEVRGCCSIAENWYSFSQLVTRQLRVVHETLGADRDHLDQLLSADNTYCELQRALSKSQRVLN
jgi:glycosyltransferase involved in cell wall biosynthesis